jgi:hypothetical protein
LRHLPKVTPNNKYFFSGQIVSTDPGSPTGDALHFQRTSDGGAQPTYQFGTNRVSAGKINPAGTLFSYAIRPPSGAACTSYMAQMPALP